MDYTSVSLRLHAPCRDRDKMNCILWLYSRSFFSFFSTNVDAFSLHCEAWSECGIVFAFQQPHNHCIFTFLKGKLSVYLSEVGDWGLMYMDGFSHFVNDISFLLWLVLHSWNTRPHPYFVQCIITFQNKVRPSGNDAYKHTCHVFLYADPHRV